MKTTIKCHLCKLPFMGVENKEDTCPTCLCLISGKCPYCNKELYNSDTFEDKKIFECVTCDRIFKLNIF